MVLPFPVRPSFELLTGRGYSNAASMLLAVSVQALNVVGVCSVVLFYVRTLYGLEYEPVLSLTQGHPSERGKRRAVFSSTSIPSPQ
jgi:hypothetical protein